MSEPEAYKPMSPEERWAMMDETFDSMVRYFHDAVTSDPSSLKASFWSELIAFFRSAGYLEHYRQFGKPTVEQPRDYSKLPFVEPMSSETADLPPPRKPSDLPFPSG